MQNLNFTQLFYFKTVVEQEGVSKASKVLNVGPSAVSMQIKSLEDYLGKELFSRKKRSLVLTPDGKLVYEYAREVFRIGTELLAHVRDNESPKHFKFVAGIQNSIPKNLIAKMSSYIYENFDAHLAIYSGNLDELTMQVINNQIDLAILNYPPLVKNKEVLHSKCILKSPVVLAGSKRFLELKGKSLKAFSDVPMILPTTDLELRHKVEIEFARNNLELDIVGEADDTIIKKNMAIAGNGVIPIMKEAIKSYVQSGQLHILSDALNLQDEVWLITSRRKKPHPVVESLMKDFHF